MKLEKLRELAEARERNKHEDPSDDGERFEGAMDRHADALLDVVEAAWFCSTTDYMGSAESAKREMQMALKKAIAKLEAIK